MGIRLRHPLIGALVSGAVCAGSLFVGLAAPASAVSKGGDVAIAKAGTFVVADFPAGFAAHAATPSSSAENIKLAKGVPGCAPYIALEKLTGAQPHATSPDFEDASRTISNEVDVFKSARVAGDALALFAKPSMVSCLQQLFKKQISQDPKTKGKIESVSINLDRQDIAGLGDDSVVYEGKMEITGTDGSTTEIGVGNAAVQVGRAVNDVTYLTTGAALTDVLAPAIDASVARLRTVVGGSAATASNTAASNTATLNAATSNSKEVARAGVLQLSDFPTGWKQSPRQSSSDDELDARAAKITSCKQFLAFRKANKKNPRAKSPNFDLAQAHVTNTVSVYPSAVKATAAMRTFSDVKLPDCLRKLFSAEFKARLAKNPAVAKQLASVKVDIGKLDGVEIGDEAVAYEGAVAVGLKDGTVTNIGLAVIAVRVDDAVTGYSYTSDTDISAALQPAIVSSVSRLHQATAASSAT